MKVETLIYAYLAICGAMIIFNIVCVFAFRRRDKNLTVYSDMFTKTVGEQIRRLEAGGQVEKKHCDMLMKKLGRVDYLMALDETLETMYRENPLAVSKYIQSLSSVFVCLALEYGKKSTLKATYFPYFIKKYKVFHNHNISVVSDVMLEMVRQPSLYCRENALQALYSIGDCDQIIKALKIIDRSGYYHNAKMITDGLTTFDGDLKRLAEKLWHFYMTCKEEMKVAILNYFRFRSGDHCERMLEIMTEPDQSQEICYACIRYFGKYHYEPAYPFLTAYAEYDRDGRWEYAAIAVSALANYPCDKTVDILKRQIHSHYWHVRCNASESLQCMGLGYEELIDVFEGTDRYAGEILRYRLDQKRMVQEHGEV